MTGRCRRSSAFILAVLVSASTLTSWQLLNLDAARSQPPATVQPVLLEHLLPRNSPFTSRMAYDLGHLLMVPIYAAFVLEDREAIHEIGRYLAVDMTRVVGDPDVDRLSKLQYAYLGSKYLALSTSYGKPLLSERIADELYGLIQALWIEQPAWQWNRSPFSGGMRDRLEWKLATPRAQPAYQSAVVDEELFLFAVAADLRCYERLVPGKRNWKLLGEILDVCHRVFVQRSSFLPTGGWLFQAGYWTNHQDFAYAGHADLAEGLRPKPLLGIAQDSSHGHRFPVWLHSLSSADDGSNPRSAFYRGLLERLGRQYEHAILVPPDAKSGNYRLNNFMDGHNGVYRYRYATLGKKLGFGAFELSGVLLAGWWGLLPLNSNLEAYRDIRRGLVTPDYLMDGHLYQKNASRRYLPYYRYMADRIVRMHENGRSPLQIPR